MTNAAFDFRLCQNVKTFLLNDRVEDALVVIDDTGKLKYSLEWDNPCVKCVVEKAESFCSNVRGDRYEWIVLFGCSKDNMKSFVDDLIRSAAERCNKGVLVLQANEDSRALVDLVVGEGFELDDETSNHLTRCASTTNFPNYVFYKKRANGKNSKVTIQADMDETSVDLEDPDNIEQSLYDMCLTSIPVPPESKRTFRVPGSNRLGICLIEFRRVRWLKYIVRKIAHVYGGTDVSLYIVHGTQNGSLFRAICKDYENVQYIEYPYDNIDRDMYADICCDVEFYRRFKTQFVLKMEWDSFIRKPIPEEYFKYAYVGAPWQGYPNDVHGTNLFKRLGNKLVGNGGFSLRNVSRMIEICEKNKGMRESNVGEDVFITNHLTDEEIPDFISASGFAVEFVHNPDPVGLHHVWTIHPPDVVRRWMTTP